MSILAGILGFIVLINFFTIRNLSKEKGFYKAQAIKYGTRVYGSSEISIGNQLKRDWHERNIKK
mgnify:CR=1 FL=1